MGLTEEQKNLAMVVAGKISGGISVVSSLFIIRDIYKKWKAQRRVDRLPSTTLLVLSMSVGDVGVSFFVFFLGSWMVPTEGDFPLAAGTEATCEAQAFFFGAFFGASNMTNGVMALIYWLVICREKPEKDLRAWYWRSLMFGFPWLWGIAYAAASRYTLAPAEYSMFWYCYSMFAEPGTKGAMISFWFVFLFFCLAFILIVLSMGALVRYVYKQEKRMDRFRRQESQPSQQTHGSSSTSTANTLANRVKTIQVAKQGFLYTLAFLVISVPMAITGFVFNLAAGGDYSKMGLPMGYYVFYACILPLQGFFNFFIYFRPKFAAIQHRQGLTFGQTTLTALRLNYARKENVSELESPGDGKHKHNEQPEVGSMEGSTFDGQVKRMSVVLKIKDPHAFAETDVEETGGEQMAGDECVDEDSSTPVDTKRKAVEFMQDSSAESDA